MGHVVPQARTREQRCAHKKARKQKHKIDATLTLSKASSAPVTTEEEGNGLGDQRLSLPLHGVRALLISLFAVGCNPPRQQTDDSGRVARAREENRKRLRRQKQSRKSCLHTLREPPRHARWRHEHAIGAHEPQLQRHADLKVMRASSLTYERLRDERVRVGNLID